MAGRSRATLTLGRSRSCDLVFEDESVSRVHAEVTVTPSGRLYLNDRGSSQGTFVDDGSGHRRVSQQFVEHGDRLWFGDVGLTGAELLERARLHEPRAVSRNAESAGPPETAAEGPRRPRWDPERGELRDNDSGRR